MTLHVGLLVFFWKAIDAALIPGVEDIDFGVDFVAGNSNHLKTFGFGMEQSDEPSMCSHC
jgi:hypothetical protein